VNFTKLPFLRVPNLFVLLLSVFTTAQTSAFSADPELGVEARVFAHDGFAHQGNFVQSAVFRGEFVFETSESSQLVVTPFARVDSEDDQRTHADVRELFWSMVGDNWEFSLGAKQVFWGVTEFNHLVDIINQTDLVENIDSEEKLGQPMAHLAFHGDWGVLDLFLVSGFRERTFPGEDRRLRLPFEIDDDDTRFESNDKRSHVDVALRWSHQIGGLDIGLYHFNGTARAPLFALEERPETLPVLIPEYALIDQTGLDAQYLTSNWAFKLESTRRSGGGETFHAVTGGVEYTVVGLFGSTVDLGLVAEYFHDERGEAAYDTLLEDDYAVGLRFGFNDADDSQALLGVIRDVDSGETAISLEASRRLGEHLSVSLEARVFSGSESLDGDDPSTWIPDRDSKAAYLDREDHVQLELKWHF